MTNLSTRKSRLHFETSDSIREAGQYRAVIVEASPLTATLRLKGTRRRLTGSWAGFYEYLALCEANRLRAERQARKKAKR